MQRYIVYLFQIFSNYRSFLISFGVIGFLAFLYEPLATSQIALSLKNLFVVTTATIYGDLFFFTVIASCLIMLLHKISQANSKAPEFKYDGLIPTVTLLIYLPLRLNLLKDDWHFLEFKSFPNITYSDTIVLLFILIVYNPKRKFAPQKTAKNLLIEDNLFENRKVDVLKREPYASHIAYVINEQSTNKSFAIGITGKWGSGKSVFLEQLCNKLENAIIIPFNPWLSKKTNLIIDDFFNVVAEKIDPYNNTLSKQLKTYADTLLDVEDTINIKFSRAIGLSSSDSYSSLEKQRYNIRQNILKQELKLVVLIDDLDRLNGEEILSVLSLIRNSFNFPNTFFTVAFDHDYVIDVLKKKDISNPLLFLEKIFQLEIDLPSFPNEILKPQLIELLSQGKTESQIQELSSIFDELDKQVGFTNLFRNLRECIKFANSVNLSYHKKIMEVDIADSIALELIKFKDRKVHEHLRCVLMKEEKADYLLFSNNNRELEFAATETTEEWGSTINSLINFLLSRREYDKLKSLRTLGNSIRYFSDHLFGSISFSQFDCYKSDKNPDAFSSFIKDEIRKKNESVLFELIAKTNDFPDKQSLFSFLKGALYLTNVIKDAKLARFCYSAIANNGDHELFESQEAFDEFLLAVLSTDEIPFAQTALIADLTAKRKSITSDYIEEINITNLATIFKGYISKQFAPSKEYFTTWVEMLSNLNPDFVKSDPETLKILKAYLLKHRHYYLYSIKYLEVGDKYELENTVGLYLGWDFFESLFEKTMEDYEILQLKSFYAQYKSNKYQPIYYDFGSVSVISGYETKFTHSPQYPHVPKGNPVITNPHSKLAQSAIIEQLKYSNWISHTVDISKKESIEGGDYFFERQLNLYFIQKIKSITLYFIVDDFLSLTINGTTICSDVETPGGIPHIVDIQPFVNLGFNNFQFKIRNVNYPAATILTDPKANPYEFIYTILIGFELKENLNKLNN